MEPNLYNIEPREFLILDRDEYDNNVQYTLEAVKKPERCPVCGSQEFIGKGINDRKARDLSEFGKLVGLVIRVHRYKCKEYGTSWSDEFESVPFKAKMTKRMRDYICKRSLYVPFSEIKRDLDISVPTIKGVFHEHIEELDNKHKLIAPKVLGMDETLLQGKYRGMYTDIENARIIDMTENRDKDTVLRWLDNLPEKENIKCVTIDMWGAYKDVVEYMLPNVPIVIDKFHVCEHVHADFDEIRKRLQGELDSKQKSYIKGKWRLLQHNAANLSYAGQVTLHKLLETFPQFKEPHSIKEDFGDVYHARSRIEAEAIFEKWAERAIRYPEYEEAVNMICNWHKYIFNYFDYHYTNATTEALNRLAKEISSKGRGYSYDVLKAKCVYGTKAAKPAKYEYKKKKSYNTFNMRSIGYANYMVPISTASHKNLIAAPGTDIFELLEEIKHWNDSDSKDNENFFQSDDCFL